MLFRLLVNLSKSVLFCMFMLYSIVYGSSITFLVFQTNNLTFPKVVVFLLRIRRM